MGPTTYPRWSLLLSVIVCVAFATGGVVGAFYAHWRVGRNQPASPSKQVPHQAVGVPVAPRPEPDAAAAYGTPAWPFFDLLHEAPGFGNRPYSFVPLGPIMTLRHLLCERQWQSFNSRDPRAPFLARFEIVDACSKGPWEVSGADLARFRYDFKVTAVLYWAYLDPATGVPPAATRVWQLQGPSGPSGGMENGPRLAKARVETVEYTVTPKDSYVATAPNRKNLKGVIQGKTGWTVTEETRIEKNHHMQPLPSFTTTVTDGNDIIPLYDPSVLKLDKQVVERYGAEQPRPIYPP